MSSKQVHTEEKSVNDLMSNSVDSVVEKSKRQQYFEVQRRNLADREIQLELLFSQKILIETMDRVRGNTNTLIWWLIVLPFIFGLILMMLGLGSLV